jgi:hypothetical protein
MFIAIIVCKILNRFWQTLWKYVIAENDWTSANQWRFSAGVVHYFTRYQKLTTHLHHTNFMKYFLLTACRGEESTTVNRLTVTSLLVKARKQIQKHYLNSTVAIKFERVKFNIYSKTSSLYYVEKINNKNHYYHFRIYRFGSRRTFPTSLDVRRY